MNPEVKKAVHVLEPSEHPHTMEAGSIEVKDLGDGHQMLTIEGKGIVTHGEHGTIGTESKHVHKIVQQEFNPVTQLMQAAYD